MKDTDILEHIQQMTTKTSGHWISQYTKAGTKLNLFSWKRLREELIAPYNSLQPEYVVKKDPDSSQRYAVERRAQVGTQEILT